MSDDTKTEDGGEPKNVLRSLDFQKDEFSGSVEELKRLLPHLISMAPIVAKVRRARYDALLAEGFTKDQALTLCENGDL